MRDVVTNERSIRRTVSRVRLAISARWRRRTRKINKIVKISPANSMGNFRVDGKTFPITEKTAFGKTLGGRFRVSVHSFVLRDSIEFSE